MHTSARPGLHPPRRQDLAVQHIQSISFPILVSYQSRSNERIPNVAYIPYLRAFSHPASIGTIEGSKSSPQNRQTSACRGSGRSGRPHLYGSIGPNQIVATSKLTDLDPHLIRQINSSTNIQPFYQYRTIKCKMLNIHVYKYITSVQYLMSFSPVLHFSPLTCTHSRIAVST